MTVTAQKVGRLARLWPGRQVASASHTPDGREPTDTPQNRPMTAAELIAMARSSRQYQEAREPQRLEQI